MKSSSKLRAFIHANMINTTFHPKIGRTILATSKPMRDAMAVPTNNNEYTLEPSLYTKTNKKVSKIIKNYGKWTDIGIINDNTY